MGTTTQDRERRGQAPDAAYTTRPRRLLLIGRVIPGQEVALLDAHKRLSVEAAERAGIDAVEAFVGSGHYALLLEIEDENAQDVLAAYFNDPAARAFRAELQQMVSGFPGPDWEYVPADDFHAAAERLAAAEGPAYSSADLPVAASVFHWER